MFFWAGPSCAFRTSQIHQVGLLELSVVKHEYFESILILVMVMLRCGLPHEALDQTCSNTRI